MAGISVDIGEKCFAQSIFKDFELHVAPGETLAILGPSGTGKSTLLRLIAGIDQDFTGAISIDGTPAHLALAPGFVFQDSRLLPWLSVLENVRLGGTGAEHLLDRVGLKGREGDFPHQLSGGMQRRVALARALASSSGLLLLDEPFVSLDRALADEMQTLLAELVAATRPTMLLVTHSPEEAARLARRVIVLEGRPARVVSDRS